jgi:hypothetical protein
MIFSLSSPQSLGYNAIYTHTERRSSSNNISDMWTYEIDTRSPEKHMPRYVPMPDIEYVTDTDDDMYFEEPKEYILVTTICERVMVSGDGKRDVVGDVNGLKVCLICLVETRRGGVVGVVVVDPLFSFA